MNTEPKHPKPPQVSFAELRYYAPNSKGELIRGSIYYNRDSIPARHKLGLFIDALLTARGEVESMTIWEPHWLMERIRAVYGQNASLPMHGILSLDTHFFVQGYYKEVRRIRANIKHKVPSQETA